MHNREVPDIVKKLLEEERLGTLQSKVQSTYEELKNQEEALSKGESDKSIFFNDKEDEESRLISDDNLESDHNTFTNTYEIYKIIFENSSFGITIVDNKERIVSWNTHAEELLNLTENELYCKPVESLYPVEEWEKIRAENVRQKGIKYRMETQLIRKDYGPFDVELSLCSLRGEDGKNVGTLGIIKDISKLKIIQNKLDDSEERFKTIFNNSAVAITVTNSKEQIISWNNYAEQLLGYSEKDLLMKHVSILYPPDEWAKIRSENVRQKGMQHHLETKIICKNNKEIDVDISLSVLKNYEGNIIGSIGIIRDITERKFIEVSLEQSEKKFKQLYQQAPVPYHTLSPDGQITDVNNKWCQILGYKKEEVIGKSIFDFIVKDERKKAKNSFNEKMISKKIYTGGHERTFLTKNGEKRIFIINDFLSFDSFDKNHNIRSVHTTMEDITDRKNLEREIEKSKKHFQNLFNNIIDPVVIVDSKGKFLEISDKIEKSTGHKKEDLIGKSFMKVKVVTEKSKRLLLKNLIKRMAGVKIKPYEIEVLTTDGRVLPFEINAAKIEYLGKPADMVIFRDVSERKKMQKELLESEERFRQVAENAQEWIWEVDAHGLYTYASPAVEKILGYTQKEIVGKKHFYDLFHPEERDTLKKVAFEVFKQKQQFRELLNRNVHKDGNDVWLSTSGFPILDANGDLTGYRGGDADITDRKKIENDLNISLKNQETITEISRLFNGLEDFNTKMNKSLEILGRSINVSRVYVFEDYDDGKMTSNTFEWCNEGIESQIDNSLEGPYYMVPSLKEILAKKGLIKSSDIKELPKDVYDVLAPQKIKSILILPLKTDEKTFGLIGFDDCIKHKKWSKNEIELLTAVSQVLTVSYQRKKAEGELKKQTKALAEANVRATELVKNLEKSQTELKEKIDELERFKKVTVGRELKMIELKKKIEELENKEGKK